MRVFDEVKEIQREQAENPKRENDDFEGISVVEDHKTATGSFFTIVKDSQFERHIILY